MSEQPCNAWAPGRDLPDGICEKCGHHRRDHLKDHRAQASGAAPAKPISREEYAFADSGEAEKPQNVSPASGAAKVRPNAVYCRWCGQGIVLGPEVKDADSYPCPKCGKSGPKPLSYSPTKAEKPVDDNEETRRQAAFEAVVRGDKPASETAQYMEWYQAGREMAEKDKAKSVEAVTPTPEPIPPPVASAVTPKVDAKAEAKAEEKR